MITKSDLLLVTMPSSVLIPFIYGFYFILKGHHPFIYGKCLAFAGILRFKQNYIAPFRLIISEKVPLLGKIFLLPSLETFLPPLSPPPPMPYKHI